MTRIGTDGFSSTAFHRPAPDRSFDAAAAVAARARVTADHTHRCSTSTPRILWLASGADWRRRRSLAGGGMLNLQGRWLKLAAVPMKR